MILVRFVCVVVQLSGSDMGSEAETLSGEAMPSMCGALALAERERFGVTVVDGR